MRICSCFIFCQVEQCSAKRMILYTIIIIVAIKSEFGSTKCWYETNSLDIQYFNLGFAFPLVMHSMFYTTKTDLVVLLFKIIHLHLYCKPLRKCYKEQRNDFAAPWASLKMVLFSVNVDVVTSLLPQSSTLLRARANTT